MNLVINIGGIEIIREAGRKPGSGAICLQDIDLG